MLKIAKNEFVEALKNISGATATNSTVEALQNVRVTKSGDNTYFAASNTTTSAKKKLETATGDDIDIVIPQRDLLNTVAKFDGETIIIEPQDSVNVISCGKGKVEVPVISLDNWVELTDDSEPTLVVPAGKFHNELKAIAHSLGNEDDNAMFSSIHLVINKDGSIFAEALDGHRMSCRGEKGDAAIDTVVDYSNIKTAIGILNKDEEVKIAVNDNGVISVGDGTNTICMQSMKDKQYFNTAQIYSVPTDILVDFDKNELGTVMEAAASLGSKKTVFEITSDGKCHISDANEMKTIKMSYDMSVMANNDLKIAINPSYIIDTLKNISEETVTFKMKDKKSPIIVSGEGYCEVILPVTID